MKNTGMVYKTCRVALSCLVCLFFVFSCMSCDFFSENKLSENEIKLDVAWRIPFNKGCPSLKPLIYNDIMYIPFIINTNNIIKYGLQAINVTTGAKIWQLDNIGVFRSNPVRIDDTIYIFSEYTTISGNKAKIYRIGLDGSNKSEIIIGGQEIVPRMNSVISKGNKIYWPTWNGGYAVLDISNTQNVDGTLVATPKIIYQDIQPNCLIPSPGLFFNGNIYLTRNAEFFDEPTKIIVIDEEIETVSVIWTLPSFLGGNESHAAIPYNNTLNFVGSGVYGLNLDGSICYKVIGSENGGAGVDNRINYQDNMIFITNTASKEVIPNHPNIIAFDMAQGKMKWGASVSGSCGSEPQVHNGIFYATTQTKVILFNAENGKQLGVDPTIHGDRWQGNSSFKIGDLFVFQNGDELIAFKMNYKIDLFGNLAK